MRSGTHVHVHAGKKRSRITELPERLSRIGVQTDDHFVVAAAVHRVQSLTAVVDQNARMAKSNIALPQALRTLVRPRSGQSGVGNLEVARGPSPLRPAARGQRRRSQNPIQCREQSHLLHRLPTGLSAKAPALDSIFFNSFSCSIFSSSDA